MSPEDRAALARHVYPEGEAKATRDMERTEAATVKRITEWFRERGSEPGGASSGVSLTRSSASLEEAPMPSSEPKVCAECGQPVTDEFPGGQWGTGRWAHHRTMTCIAAIGAAVTALGVAEVTAEPSDDEKVTYWINRWLGACAQLEAVHAYRRKCARLRTEPTTRGLRDALAASEPVAEVIPAHNHDARGVYPGCPACGTAVVGWLDEHTRKEPTS